jgi:F-type H+-transporting ATPase subunit b
MAEDTNVATDAADAAQAPGMPQLDFSTYANQIFWLLVALVVLYFVLSKIALPRIAAVLAERQGTISGDLAAAEDLKAKAAEAEQAYNKALADARSEAHSIVAAAKADIKAELDEANEKADAEIAEKTAEGEKKIAEIRASAMQDIKEVAEATAAELVTTMGGKADDKVIASAVSARLEG